MAKKHSKTQYTFKVNLKGSKRMWRTVVLRGDHTLTDLHEIIFEAFDRFEEHLYSFYFPKAISSGRFDFQPKEYTSPIMLKERDPFSPRRPISAAKTTLDSLHLQLGQTFEYLFDFGDNWLHEIKVVSKEPVQSQIKLPMILERKGDSPPQYPEPEE